MFSNKRRNASADGRTVMGELIFWVVLLGVDALFLYLIHLRFGQWYNYKDTMPVMLAVGAFIPLAAIVFRYFPKKTAVRIIGCVLCVPAAVLIGMVTLHAFYGEAAPLGNMIYGEPFPGVDIGETAELTLSEFQAGKQVGEAVTGAGGDQYTKTNMNYRSTDKARPEPEDYMLYTYTGTDGRTCNLRIYDDGKYNYIDMEDERRWRMKNSSSSSTNYLSTQSTYVILSFQNAFLDHMEDGEFTLAEDYNGGGKAVWLEEDEVFTNTWYDRFIPEEFTAERVEDVRYVFLCAIASSTYKGYWYDARTGQKLDDSYDITYRMTAYDLEEGTETVLTESTGDIFDARELVTAYLEEKTGQKIQTEEGS